MFYPQLFVGTFSKGFYDHLIHKFILKLILNDILIKSDHEIWTLFQRPWEKVGVGKWWTRNHETFYAAQNLKIISKRYGFLQNNLRDFWFFIISHILILWKMLFRSFKKVCGEVSKIKNVRCTFFLFFRARRRGIWHFSDIHTCLAANWDRKWYVFGFWKKWKISQ